MALTLLHSTISFVTSLKKIKVFSCCQSSFYENCNQDSGIDRRVNLYLILQSRVGNYPILIIFTRSKNIPLRGKNKNVVPWKTNQPWNMFFSVSWYKEAQSSDIFEGIFAA